MPFSAFEWLPSNGKDSYWIGGPRKDSNANNELGESVCSSVFVTSVRVALRWSRGAILAVGGGKGMVDFGILGKFCDNHQIVADISQLCRGKFGT